MGKEWIVMRLQQATKHVWWLTYEYKNKMRSCANGHNLVMIKRWSWTPTYVNHNTETVFTSRTPPRRDHHGYTRGWCVLIRIWCQVIYNRTLTNSHLPITAGTAFERLYPAGVSQLIPWQALAINEGIDLLPGRPDQTRNPGYTSFWQW